MEMSDEERTAYLIGAIKAFEQLAPRIHWFCPADGNVKAIDKVTIKSEGPDLWQVVAQDLEKCHLARQKAFRDCLDFYAYEGPEAVQFQEFLKTEVKRNLERCDQCIVEYYKLKNGWLEQIEITETSDASAFVASRLNDIDVTRIVHKLDNLSLALRQQDTETHPARYGLLDALSCENFLRQDELVRQHLDRPFKYLWESALPRVSCYLPATTMFLFEPDSARRQWAFSAWSEYAVMTREDDFNFAVRGPLFQILQGTNSIGNNSKSLELFWVGVRTIISKLDTSLITHSLRALEAPDVFRLSLEHLRWDKTGLRYILQALSVLLQRAPKDYWESMGAISPTAVIEQIFNEHFTSILAETWVIDTPAASSIRDLFDWIRPFVSSLETVHQSQACRAISAQLLRKLQQASLPANAKIECWRKGLGVIKFTLLNCNKEHPTFGATGRVVAAETLDVVSEYIERILTLPTLPETDPWYEPCAAVSLDIVELALTLECKSLRTDQETLRKSRDMDPGTCSYGPAIWDKLVKQLVHTNVDLARTALSGINGLMGLEKFVTVKDEVNRSYKSDYNVKLSHLTHLVCQMLERINDFDPVDLDRLFRKPATATALVASLFSPDASTYEAGVNLMKTISSESVRQEAIRHVVLSFFDITLDAMSRALRRIAQTRVYASCPRMLKTCKDVLDILCDSQTGLFRSRTLETTAEIRSVENFWQHLWEILKVIYEMTDAWSKAHVADPEVMKEFVRDTMDFSERLLDEYSIFASAIDSAVPVKKEEGTDEDKGNAVAKRLLAPPAKTMEVIVKWLRLRDLYLVGMSVKLTKKLLDRLSEKAMILAKEPSDFVELVIRGGPQGRTNLSLQEKAELARALEANIGRPIASVEPEVEQSSAVGYPSKRTQTTPATKKAKNGTIDLEAWKSKSKYTAQVIDLATEDEFGDSDIVDADFLYASRLSEELKKLPSKVQPPKNLLKAVTKRESKDAKLDRQKQAQVASFSEQRKKDLEAKKKRDAEIVALQRKKIGTVTGSLGIQGIDHAPKQTGVMVSSGSDAETEDETDRDLFGSMPKANKISAGALDIHADRLRQIKEKGPVKKTKQVRSTKDMRARLAPDLTSLHKTILGWEYFHAGDTPPHSGRVDYSLVANTFRTPDAYQGVFEPLLTLEGWQAFLKSKEESSAKIFEIKIANRMTVDSFVEVSTTMTLNEGKDLGLSEADVILISKGQSPASESQQPHCLARVSKISRKKGNMDISYRINVGNAPSSMTPNATLYGVKILSLTPLEREYGALYGLQYFDLCDEIIRAKPSPILEYSEKQLETLCSKYKVNAAQAKAVRSAIDNDAFTLIQGPPGSGKTKTIVAIVGALLTGQFEQQGTAIARPQTNGQKPAFSSGANTSKKMLICAPSNAAVDELVMRFKDGVKTMDGIFHKPSVVRLGRSDAINTKVVDVTLEELVNARLSMTNDRKPRSGEDVQQIMMAHKSTCDEFNAHRASMDALKASGTPITHEQERTFEVLKRKKQQLSNQIDSARDNSAAVTRDAEITRRKIQQEILEGAHIICATLSGSGHEMFQSLNIEFETVVIDEAAQSIELSALIPLKYGCSKCILVGDPKQLPPTVLSREAARFQYEQSLFVRMQTNHPNDVHLLDTQYRMHPEISLFPSKAFYDGRLLDGKDMADLRARPWHQSDVLGPYRFFDVRGTQQSAPRGYSLTNKAEIDMAMKLFARLTTDGNGYDFTGKVGIITPYKSQLRDLRFYFAQRYGEAIFNTIEFNTTDAFQGRESEIIIFSCVRATMKGIGFVSDIRRMNVGITRAKCSLWVLGNTQSLMQGEFWAKLINDAKSRNRYSGPEVQSLLEKPLFKMDPAFVSKRKNNSTSMVSPTASDVEMTDAPSFDLANVAPQAIKSPAIKLGSDTKFADGQSKEYFPSGGHNGLNTNSNCALCGSTTHHTFMCDNEAAKVSSRGRCYRCGDLNHEKERCAVERCLECGDFGHTLHTCTNPLTLTRSEKERLRIFESSHQRFLQRQPEKQRKRQLGDHDKTVPAVLSTVEVPQPTDPKKAQQYQPVGKKRQREPSPPASAPKGPKLASGSSHRAKVQLNNQMKSKSVPLEIASSRPQNLPLRSPTLSSTNSNGSSNSKSTQDRFKLPISPTETIPPLTAGGPRNPNSRSGSSESNANPPSASTSSLPKRPPMANVKPPVKKKKEVNPFLVPSKKRR